MVCVFFSGNFVSNYIIIKKTKEAHENLHRKTFGKHKKKQRTMMFGFKGIL